MKKVSHWTLSIHFDSLKLSSNTDHNFNKSILVLNLE